MAGKSNGNGEGTPQGDMVPLVVKVPRQVRKDLKVRAAQEDVTLQELVSRLMGDALR